MQGYVLLLIMYMRNTMLIFSVPILLMFTGQLNAYSANNNDYAQDPLNDSTSVQDRQNQIHVPREPPKSQTFPNKAFFSSRERQARVQAVSRLEIGGFRVSQLH